MVSLETELMDCPCQEELLEDGDVNGKSSNFAAYAWCELLSVKSGVWIA